MTHLLAAVAQLLKQAFCLHPVRTSRPLAVHPADGRPIYAWHCEKCEGTGVDYAP